MTTVFEVFDLVYKNLEDLMKNLVDLDDFSLEEVELILDKAADIKTNMSKFSDAMSGKIIATLFYEPSTRTQMSFQTAMIKLGGQVIGFDNPTNSSIAKGEDLKDTIKIISQYADVIAIRHNLEGSARAAACFSSCPVINAGDGGHLHPTQTLTDLLTIKEMKGSLGGLTFGFCGDLKNGRTVHSLVKMLLRYKNNKFIFMSTDQLKIPDYIKKIITESKNQFEESRSLENSIGKLDILYMTRIQKERFRFEKTPLDAQKSVFKLGKNTLKKAKSNMLILHPLPRVDEIDFEVDSDPRAVYFRQAANGVFARMALIMHVLSAPEVENFQTLSMDKCCCNNRCITNFEKYLPKRFIKNKESYFCYYCSQKLNI